VGPTGGYGPTPAYVGPAASSGPKTNVLSIVSLVTGILGILTCSCLGVMSIAAIVTGVLGRNQIKASNGLETGDGMALAGLITGAIGLVLGFGWLALSIAGNA
jgi:hypothetical protein